jgi:PD-(D/E)XK nuclease superfamily
MTDPTTLFYQTLKTHFDNQINDKTESGKRLIKSIQDKSPDRLVDMIISVDEFIKQNHDILSFKNKMWKDLISKSTTRTSDGEFVHEISTNHKVKFKTLDELLSYLNKEIVPVVMNHFDQTLASIYVEYCVRTIIRGLKGKEQKDQFDFLTISLKVISEKNELSKYLKAKISEHLNYYRLILEIQRKDFDNALFSNLTERENISRLRQALTAEKFSEFREILRPIFASIPNQIILNNEKYYHSIFFVILNLLGFEILAEVNTNLGRIDAVIEFSNLVYILEFKMDEADTAIQQIKDKKYYEKYLGKSRKIILVGVAFDRQQKNIGEFKLEYYEK